MPDTPDTPTPSTPQPDPSPTEAPDVEINVDNTPEAPADPSGDA